MRRLRPNTAIQRAAFAQEKGQGLRLGLKSAKREDLADAETVVDDAGRQEHQKLALGVLPQLITEQISYYRQIAEERNLCDLRRLVLQIDTADHNRAAVFDQHLRLNVTRIYRNATRNRVAA